MGELKEKQCVRDMIHANEEKFLSSFACKSSQTKGRAREERSCDFRTEFQRDRDRIIYSKAFKRLKNKTQVFVAPEGDHYTHIKQTPASEPLTLVHFHLLPSLRSLSTSSPQEGILITAPKKIKYFYMYLLKICIRPV